MNTGGVFGCGGVDLLGDPRGLSGRHSHLLCLCLLGRRGPLRGGHAGGRWGTGRKITEPQTTKRLNTMVCLEVQIHRILILDPPFLRDEQTQGFRQ